MEDLNFLQESFLAGVDEVGRGPLAGPVVAACAVITGGNFSEREAAIKSIHDLGVTDSKKLTAKKRVKLIQEFGYSLEDLKVDQLFNVGHFNNCKISVVISEISPALIDKMNILAASLEAMAVAFERHACQGQGWILVDGTHRLKRSWNGVKQEPLVKGDSRAVMVGLASIFAKEYRDHLMRKLGAQYPGYGLESHAGYPTPSHKEAIAKLGVTPIHRKSFRGVKEHL